VVKAVNISIVIVNWNTKEILKNCLQSIYEQTKDIAFETIVIDNGSTDGSVEMIKGRFPEVVLIENDENRGFAAANNQGIAIAKGQYVLLLNSDTVILDNAIEKTFKFAEENPDSGVIGCRVLNSDKTLQPTCFMFPSLVNRVLFTGYFYKLFPKNKFFGRERMTWWNRNTQREVDVVTGCYMLVSRKAIEQVGVMDEIFFMYAEEIDWCYRFKQAGWKNLFTPDAEIIHLGGASAIRHKAERALLKDKSDILFMCKYWPKWKVCLGVTLKGLFYLTRLLVIFPLYIVKRKQSYRDIINNHLAGLKYLLRFQYCSKDN